MKKIFMTLAAAIIAVSASAQVYVGGNVGISSVKLGDADAETSYKFLPEVGYNINDNWAVGMSLGWAKGTPVTIENVNALAETFEVNPYVRFTPFHTQYINVFFDGGLGYKKFNRNLGSDWSIGIRPGVAVNLNQHFSFVAHVGFLGYKWHDPKGDAKNSSAWGVDLDGNNVTFGLYYNF